MLYGHQYGYQMKSLDQGNKNMLFIFQFLCLFTFHQHNSQWLREFLKVYAALRGRNRPFLENWLTLCHCQSKI
jgi:hypothetical protein